VLLTNVGSTLARLDVHCDIHRSLPGVSDGRLHTVRDLMRVDDRQIRFHEHMDINERLSPYTPCS